MSWSYSARMDRAIANLINSGRIDRADIYKRAKFFGQYAFRVNLGVNYLQWPNFNDLAENYRKVFEAMGAHVVVVKSTLDVYVYSNNPSVLTWLNKHPSACVNSVVQTDPAFWHKKLPKSKKNTGQFFGEYRFRVRMRDRLWGTSKENVDQLNQLEMDSKLVLRKFHHSVSSPNVGLVSQIRDTFVYVKKLNEVLVLKLMFGDQVAEVEDRN